MLAATAGCGDVPGATGATVSTVSTDALPYGQVARPYRAQLIAAGIEYPARWRVIAGTLPAGLTLSETGAIRGIPSHTANEVTLSFEVRPARSDSDQEAQVLTLPIYISPADIHVSINPRLAGITNAQTTSLTVGTNDIVGVRWSVSPAGATISAEKSQDGASIVFLPPAGGGAFSVTATSLTDPAKSATTRIGVTDLPGVFAFHNNDARDGVNSREFALAPGTLTANSFGKLFSCVVDGAPYAQPLWMPNLVINGARRNVVFVATARNGLFAFDADKAPCELLWSADLIDAAHGGAEGETSVPAGLSSATPSPLVGIGDGSMAPEVGITGTPVIDPVAKTLYVVTKSVIVPEDPRLVILTQYLQRLHAIDLTTGAERPGSPVLIDATYPDGPDGADVAFNSRTAFQRAGLAMSRGVVYLTFASHEDVGPYYGWVLGYTYDGAQFSQSSVLNLSPDTGFAGIWMGGGAPSIDSEGNLFVTTGNGVFNATDSPPRNRDFGDSLVKLTPAGNAARASEALNVAQYFTPSDHESLLRGDLDFSAGGATVLAEYSGESPSQAARFIVAVGKDGRIFILNRDNLGGLGDEKAWQVIETGSANFSTAAYWNDTLYLIQANSLPASYSLRRADGSVGFVLRKTASTPASRFPFPGATPSISANGRKHGILWAIESNSACTVPRPGRNCARAVLRAYNTVTMSEIWNSEQAKDGADRAGNAVKFTVPTVANGKVYVGTRGNNTGGPYGSSSISGQLDVYGLKSH